VIKNIEACRELSKIARTSLGPNGMNKMVITHLAKLFVTSDTAVIVRELEVAHPAARVVVMAAEAQEREVGDGTNFVVSFAGELLSLAEELIRDGLHPSEIRDGYQKALEKCLEWLNEELAIEGTETMDLRDKVAVAKRLKGTLSSKQSGYEEQLASIVAEACVDVCPKKNAKNFNVEDVRTAKIVGGNINDVQTIHGMVIRRNVEGSVRHVENAKVAVFGCAVDTQATETKGTVLIQSGKDLEEYSKGEELQVEKYIDEIVESGCKVVFTGQSFGDLALHFLERKKIMAVKIPSKFELRRVCKATNATTLIKLGKPKPDELGYASKIDVVEIGDSKVLVLKQDDASRVSTIILRGATANAMDDLERAMDDGINAYKALTRDSRAVAAGGATEIALAKRLSDYAKTQTGLDQYAIQKFAQALELVPRTLAENAGLDATSVIASLYAAHSSSNKNNNRMGVDVSGDQETVDLCESAGIVDLLEVKHWALKLAVDAARTVLRVDQIIMSKQAGGPGPNDARAG
jgi:T-complex protein 1 subunit theta